MKMILHGLGFIAERHMRAILNNGASVAAGVDIKPQSEVTPLMGCKFVQQADGYSIVGAEGAAILTPNDTHFALAKYYAERGYRVLVEKPGAIDFDDIARYRDLGSSVSFVLQLRYHPVLRRLRAEWAKRPPEYVDIRFLVHRDDAYFNSWKGDPRRSGGLMFNLGAHCFDAITWLLGDQYEVVDVIGDNLRHVRGKILFPKTVVQFSLRCDAPIDRQERTIGWDEQTLDLTSLFPKLHTDVYRAFFSREGILIDDCAAGLGLIFGLTKRMEVRREQVQGC